MSNGGRQIDAETWESLDVPDDPAERDEWVERQRADLKDELDETVQATESDKRQAVKALGEPNERYVEVQMGPETVEFKGWTTARMEELLQKMMDGEGEAADMVELLTEFVRDGATVDGQALDREFWSLYYEEYGMLGLKDVASRAFEALDEHSEMIQKFRGE